VILQSKFEILDDDWQSSDAQRPRAWHGVPKTTLCFAGSRHIVSSDSSLFPHFIYPCPTSNWIVCGSTWKDVRSHVFFRWALKLLLSGNGWRFYLSPILSQSILPTLPLRPCFCFKVFTPLVIPHSSNSSPIKRPPFIHLNKFDSTVMLDVICQ
jgi:hypothetical protein